LGSDLGSPGVRPRKPWGQTSEALAEALKSWDAPGSKPWEALVEALGSDPNSPPLEWIGHPAPQVADRTAAAPVMEPPSGGHDPTPQRDRQHHVKTVIDGPTVSDAVTQGFLQQVFGRVDGHGDCPQEPEGVQGLGLREGAVDCELALEDAGRLGEEIRGDV